MRCLWKGERISIKNTRNCIDSILNGNILDTDFVLDDTFRFQIPVELENVSREICNPKLAWEDRDEYHKQSSKLANMFKENYKQYINPVLQIIQNMGQLHTNLFLYIFNYIKI